MFHNLLVLPSERRCGERLQRAALLASGEPAPWASGAMLWLLGAHLGCPISSPPSHPLAVSLLRGLVAGSGGAVPGVGSVREPRRAAQYAEAPWLRAEGAAWPPRGSALPELARRLPPARPAAQPLCTEPASAHVCVQCTKCGPAPAEKSRLSKASGDRVAS